MIKITSCLKEALLLNPISATYGVFYGFPDCCIKEWVDFSIDTKKTDIIDERPDLENNKFIGTGFIPCKSCAKLDYNFLVEKIQKNRYNPQIFGLMDHPLNSLPIILNKHNDFIKWDFSKVSDKKRLFYQEKQKKYFLALEKCLIDLGMEEYIYKTAGCFALVKHYPPKEPIFLLTKVKDESIKIDISFIFQSHSLSSFQIIKNLLLNKKKNTIHSILSRYAVSIGIYESLFSHHGVKVADIFSKIIHNNYPFKISISKKDLVLWLKENNTKVFDMLENKIDVDENGRLLKKNNIKKI